MSCASHRCSPSHAVEFVLKLQWLAELSCEVTGRQQRINGEEWTKTHVSELRHIQVLLREDDTKSSPQVISSLARQRLLRAVAMALEAHKEALETVGQRG